MTRIEKEKIREILKLTTTYENFNMIIGVAVLIVILIFIISLISAFWYDGWWKFTLLSVGLFVIVEVVSVMATAVMRDKMRRLYEQ